MSDPSSDLLPPEVYQEFARQIPVGKYGLVAVTMLLLYDILITFDDEVKYMWRQKFTFVTVLFLMNRYYAFIVLGISMFVEVIPAVTVTSYAIYPLAFHNASSKISIRCRKFVMLEAIGSGTTNAILPDILIGMRVYALYRRNRLLGAFLSIYIATELGVALWIYLTPSVHPAVLPGPESITNSLALHSCLGAPSTKLSNLQVASFQFMQTAYDTIVLALIIAKTITESIGQGTISLDGIRSLIVRHGVIYYVVVFTTNLTWALMIIFASQNLKYSLAALAGGLGCVSASRLTLSLRKFSSGPETTIRGDVPGSISWKVPKRRQSWIGTSTFEMSGDCTMDTFRTLTEGTP